MKKLQITICSLVLAAVLVSQVEAAPEDEEVVKPKTIFDLLPSGSKWVNKFQQLVPDLESAPNKDINPIRLITDTFSKAFDDFKADAEQFLKKILEALCSTL